MSAGKAPSQLQLCPAALPQYQIETFCLRIKQKLKRKSKLKIV